MHTQKDLLIHIGSHKTGTTAVQFACQNSILGASAKRNHYFNIRPSGDQRIVSAVGAGRKFRVSLDLAAADAVFRPEHATDQHHQFIASDEALFWINEPESIVAFGKMLRQRFDSVRILCYLRRQDLLAFSHRKQVVNGALASRFYGINPAPLPTYKDHFQSYFDYASKLSNIWCAGFGKANVMVVPYDRSLLHEGDIIADFALRSGVGFKMNKPITANAALGGNQVFLGLQLASRGVSPARRKALVKGLVADGSYRPSQQEARDFLANFRNANAQLARDWEWQGAPFSFSEDFSMYPEVADQFAQTDFKGLLDNL